MTLQEEIVFDSYFRCYAIGAKHVRIMPYDPREPFHRRYVREPRDADPALVERVHADCLKLTGALGYEFDTLEFAVRDGVPYAIDFLNPSPDADPNSVGEENFRWVLETAASWLIERVREGAPPKSMHWQEFLSPQAPAARPTKGNGSPARRRAPVRKQRPPEA
jgi:hypothetical protein